MKAEYIDIADVPRKGESKSPFPWAEWGNIPPGKALEISELVTEGQTAYKWVQATGLHNAAKRYNLAARVRGERVFICNPSEPTS